MKPLASPRAVYRSTSNANPDNSAHLVNSEPQNRLKKVTAVQSMNSLPNAMNSVDSNADIRHGMLKADSSACTIKTTT